MLYEEHEAREMKKSEQIFEESRVKEPKNCKISIIDEFSDVPEFSWYDIQLSFDNKEIRVFRVWFASNTVDPRSTHYGDKSIYHHTAGLPFNHIAVRNFIADVKAIMENNNVSSFDVEDLTEIIELIEEED